MFGTICTTVVAMARVGVKQGSSCLRLLSLNRGAWCCSKEMWWKRGGGGRAIFFCLLWLSDWLSWCCHETAENEVSAFCFVRTSLLLFGGTNIPISKFGRMSRSLCCNSGMCLVLVLVFVGRRKKRFYPPPTPCPHCVCVCIPPPTPRKNSSTFCCCFVAIYCGFAFVKFLWSFFVLVVVSLSFRASTISRQRDKLTDIRTLEL